MKRGTTEFAMHVVAMAEANPRGFRNPGRNGTSLVEQAMVACGMTSRKELRADPSDRSIARRETVRDHRERVKLQQLMGYEKSAVRRALQLGKSPDNVSKAANKLRLKAMKMAEEGIQVTFGNLVLAP